RPRPRGGRRHAGVDRVGLRPRRPRRCVPRPRRLRGGGDLMNTRRVKTVVRRHAYVLKRSPHRFFDVTVWPLLDVLLFGSLAVFGFNLASVGWGLVPITAVLLLAGWSIGMAVIGLMLRYGQSAEILAWGINFLVMALSGVFNPVDAIPPLLQPLSRILPTTHA